MHTLQEFTANLMSFRMKYDLESSKRHVLSDIIVSVKEIKTI